MGCMGSYEGGWRSLGAKGCAVEVRGGSLWVCGRDGVMELGWRDGASWGPRGQ